MELPSDFYVTVSADLFARIRIFLEPLLLWFCRRLFPHSVSQNGTKDLIIKSKAFGTQTEVPYQAGTAVKDCWAKCAGLHFRPLCPTYVLRCHWIGSQHMSWSLINSLK